jgi:DNA helicase-2/ATP-dependent DNA helicase PcrA
MDEFLKQYRLLNDDQKKAVDTIEGPVLVIAGPGTGKTQVLSLRIANILRKQDVDPKSILCLTFQDSSVLAMKTRLQRFIGSAAYKVQIHTFHSFCSEIIRTFHHLFDYDPNVEPIKDLDKLEIYKEILQENKLISLQYRNDVLGNFKGISNAISNLKKEYISTENLKDIINNFENNLDEKKRKLEAKRIEKLRDLETFYRKYLNLMQERNLIDFDDMIFKVTDAFAKNDELVQYFQEHYLYTLVDEYQDTNNAQLEVVKAISGFAGIDANVFAVGDDDQTIFRFQGASSENFDKFLNIFPKTEIIVLHTNYRSKQEIIDVSANVIGNNPGRLAESEFFTERGLDKDFRSGYWVGDVGVNAEVEDIPITQIHKFEHSFHEDYWIGEEIKAISDQGEALSEIAIIARTNKQITNITKFLDKFSIPYQIKRSESLLNDKYIKDLLLLVKIISYPLLLKDDKLIWQLLSLEIFKNNNFDIFTLFHEAKTNKQSIYDFILNPKNDSNSESALLPDLNQNKYTSIQNIFNKIIELQIYASNNSFQTVLTQIIHKFDYITYFENQINSYSMLNKLTSLYQYVQSRTKFLKNYLINDFLNEIKIMQDKNITLPIDEIDPDTEGKINILTAHGAKGLEFKYVFIYQCVENKWEKIRGGNDGISLPPLQTHPIDPQIEKESAQIDERRLFYVSMTRAKERLYLTYAKKYYDTDTGEVDTSEKTPSQFLAESKIENIFEHSDLNQKHQEISQIILQPEDPVKVPDQNIAYLNKLINKNLKLSASKINKYQKCHYKFLLEYIYKIPTTQNASAILGTIVHSSIEEIYKKDISSIEKLNELITRKVNELLSEIDSSQIEKEGTSKDVLIRDLENSIKIYFEHYISGQTKRVDSEFWCSGTINGIAINGRIDMVSKEEFGFTITDFKTSQKVPTITEFLGLTKASDKSHLRQLLFYRLLLENSDQVQSRKYSGKMQSLQIEYIDLKEQKVKVYQLPSSGEFEYKPRSNSKKTVSFDLDNEYENLKKELSETFESIKKMNFQRTEDHRECQFCAFKDHCGR